MGHVKRGLAFLISLVLGSCTHIQKQECDGRDPANVESCSSLFQTRALPQLDLSIHKMDRILNKNDIDQIEIFISSAAINDSIILFRGQKLLTETVLANKARESGHEAAVEALESRKHYFRNWIENLIKKNERELSSRDADSNGWKYREHEREELLQRLTYLKNITPEDKIILEHAKSAGGTYFVSATRALSVAAGNFQGGDGVRYIYILSVPLAKTINVQEVIKRTKASSFGREQEIAIPIDATQYILGVYDLVEHRILPLVP
jgi:hypothetical protein